MYAIIKTGGKQYIVRENDVIQVEKLDVPVGEEVVLSDVLFISGDKQGQLVGAPVVQDARITGKVVRHGLGRKIIGFTYKPKKNERRRFGHRQPYTQVLIEKITYKKPRAQKTAESATADSE